MTQNLEIKAYLKQNVMELDQFRAIWTQSLWQRTYQAISQEPWLQFSQTRPHFFKNHGMNPIKLCNHKNVLTLGPGAQKLNFGHLGPEDISCRKSRTLAPIFTNRTSFFQESWDESNKIIKLQKCLDLGAWGLETKFGSLGPRRHIQP